MTSAYFESLGKQSEAPLVDLGGTENYGVEEPNQTDSVNKQIDDLQADTESQLNLMIDQYNVIHSQRKQFPTQLANLTKTGLELKTNYENYRTEQEKWERFHRKMSTGAAADIQYMRSPTTKNLQAVGADNDKDIEKYNKAEAQGNEVQTALNGASVQAAAEGEVGEQRLLKEGGLIESDGIGPALKKSMFYENAHQATQNFELYWTLAANRMKVEVIQPNGEPKYMSFNDSTTVEEARYIANAIYYNYLVGNQEISKGVLGRYKRDLAIPLMGKVDGHVKTRIDALVEIQEKAGNIQRANDLKYRIATNPDFGVEHVNLYKDELGSVKAAKLDLAYKVADLLKTGDISRTEVAPMLDAKFHAHDSTPEKPHIVTMRDYWKPETGIMLKALRTAETNQMNEEIAEYKQALDLEGHQMVIEARERKTPYTAEEWYQKKLDLARKHNISIDQLPDSVKGYDTKQDIDDDYWERDFYRRKNRGEELTAADLEGINDPKLKAELLAKLPKGGVTQEEMDRFITPYINQKTQETDNDTAKTGKWRAYQDNARLEFRKVYAQARAAGAEHSEAIRAARDAVLKGLELGEQGDSPWASWGGVTQDVNEVNSLEQVKKGLNANASNMLNSKKPWVGEERHIREAINYVNGDAVDIPLYYRQFPSIVKLPNGKVAVPINIMKYRLKALGLLKNDEPLPEDSLPIWAQKKLRKPSPSKTLEVLQSDEGINLIPAERFDSRGRTAISALRENNQVALQYSTLNNDYRKLVNIPPELNDQFIAQVGDLPPYLQLNNLAPEVAKVLIGDVLMT
jgi:hypothetical protein